MNQPFTYHDYRKEITRLAEEAAQEEHYYDAIHQSVDRHQWVIYNAYVTTVLDHSDTDFNDMEDYADSLIQALREGGVSNLLCLLAYLAMEQDVQVAVSNLTVYDLFYDEDLGGWTIDIEGDYLLTDLTNDEYTDPEPGTKFMADGKKYAVVSSELGNIASVPCAIELEESA